MKLSHRWVRTSLTLATLVVPLAASTLAHAEACGDQVCPTNWQCQTETPPVANAPCTGKDCGASEPASYQYCAPLPCKTDADCADDMVCYTETSTDCTDPPPCAKGADCAAPASTCTPTTQSACVPRYVPPCETAADCGDGFTCETSPVSCTCGSTGSGGGSAADGGAGSPTPTPGAGSGSSGTPTPGAGSGDSSDPAAPIPSDAGAGDSRGDAAAPPPADAGAAPPDCGCPPPSTTKTCKLVVVACSTAQDCLPGWTCEENPESACAVSSDGSTSCPPADPAKICAPPYTDLVGGAAHDEGSGLFDPTTGTAENPDGGAVPPKSADNAGTANPVAGGAADDPDLSTTHESSSEGCSIGRDRGEKSAGYGVAALLALALVSMRRRTAR